MRIENNKKGVSVILCCYNSTTRLQPTLLALSKQLYDSQLEWEIILVDNASTDNTAAITTQQWDALSTGIPLRTVYEGKPGLGYARQHGISVARYDYLLFCDDDNWLDQNYIQLAYNILNGNQSIAACGGLGIPVFETKKPYWFDEYAEAFALGPQNINMEKGRILNLYGAGLAVNKLAYESLEKNGFTPLMQGRAGNKLSSSEDTELTYALLLAGYKLHYSAVLKFQHYLPIARLNMAYLKKLFTAFGNDGPIRNLYYAHISHRPFHKKMKNWHFHFTVSLFRLVKYLIVPPKKYGRSIYFNWNMAYIKQLLALKNNYKQLQLQISQTQQNLPLQLPNTNSKILNLHLSKNLKTDSLP